MAAIVASRPMLPLGVIFCVNRRLMEMGHMHFLCVMCGCFGVKDIIGGFRCARQLTVLYCSKGCRSHKRHNAWWDLWQSGAVRLFLVASVLRGCGSVAGYIHATVSGYYLVFGG